MPWPRDGFEDRREAMQRNQHRGATLRPASIERRRYCVVVRTENRVDAGGAPGFADPVIAGDLGRLADLRHRALDLGVAVAIDDEARIGLQNDRRIQQPRQLAADLADSDIPGDMPPSFMLGQTESAEPARKRAAGMVTGEEERRA